MICIKLTKENYSQFASQIAEIHKRAYSKEHMTAYFSRGKLEEYYQRLVEESELCVLALEDGGNHHETSSGYVTGFIVAGSAVSKGVSRFLLTNRLYVLSIMLMHPVFLLQKARALILPKFIKVKPSSEKFRLLSIAVLDGVQSKGVGSSMLCFFENEIMKRGVHSYGLSVRSENERAISFYERNGFQLEKCFLGSQYFVKKMVSK